MQIIGGIVAYEDGVKTVAGDQFSPTRKVRVELNFSVDQGEDATAAIQTVLGTAQAFVRTKLGLAPNTGKPEVVVEIKREPAVAPVPAGKTKADLAAEAGVGEKQVAAATPKPKGPPRAVKPKEETPKAIDPAAIVDEEPAAEVVEEESFDIPAAEEAPKISDEELNNYVGKVNQKFREMQDAGGASKIREVIGAFKPEGWTKMFTMRDIEQKDRAAAKEKLKALLPADLQKGL